MHPTSKRLLVIVLSLALLAGSILAWTLAVPPLLAETPTPEQALGQAWRNASLSGAYHFETTIRQVQHPGPSLANVGLSSEQDTLHLDGRTDLSSQTLEMSLWNEAGGATPDDAMHVLVEGGQAYGRCATCEWEPIDDVYGPVLPGADLLGYLAGATDIQDAGTETVLGIEYTLYSFDVDGVAFGAYLSEQMETYLRERGELPPGVSLDLADQYSDAEGSGELWVDPHGLPRRLSVHLDVPTGAAGDWIEADIGSTFSRYDMQYAAAPTLGENPLAWCATLLSDFAQQGDGLRSAVLQGFAVLAVVLAMALLIRFSTLRRVYALVAVGMVVSMVGMPLLQSQQVYAYQRRQMERQELLEKDNAERQAAAHWAAQSTPQLDPHADPLASRSQAEVTTTEWPRLYQGASLQDLGSGSDGDDIDGDGDGLTLAQERFLGTNPDDIDTDGDGITDDVEVEGFVDGFGTHWYLDPHDVDSNHDGRPDSLECPECLLQEGDIISPRGACRDTDGDGTPDVWDDDDDGDGVEDRVDLSPDAVLGADTPFHRDRPFNLVVDQLESGRQVFVDLQIRPENPDHLAYHYNVLDWPTGDTEGQVQRLMDTTFADQPGGGAVGDTNGDMRLIPMLEITIPHQDGHQGNLPLLHGTGPVTPTSPIEDWVDTDKLDPYGISVSYKNDAGDMLMMVPLTVVTDATGGGKAAFGAHVPYFPSSDTWGAAHQFRVIWLLQMVTDMCDLAGFTPSAAAEADDAIYTMELETYCAMPSHRVETVSIVHAYDESWSLASLSVREDHGMKLAIALEDPATDERLDHDDQLWLLALGLGESFMAGRADAQGQRDLTVDAIKARWDSQSNGAFADGDEELWGIPKNALRVTRYDLASIDDLVQIPMTITSDLLDTHFVSGGAAIHETPLLLFAREELYRAADLGMDSSIIQRTRSVGRNADDGLRVVMDTSSTPALVMNALQWQTYKHTGSAWEAYAIDDLYDTLWLELKDTLSQGEIGPDDLDVKDQTDLAMAFYLSLYQGASSLVQRGDRVYETPAAAPDSKLGTKVTNPWTWIYKKVALKILEPVIEWAKWMESFQEMYGPIKGKINNIKAFFERYKYGVKVSSVWSGRIKTGVAVGILIGGAVLALGLTVAASALGIKPIKYIANFLALAITIQSLVTAVQAIRKAVQGIQGFVNQMNAVGKNVVNSSMKAGIVGLVISVAISAVMFLVSVLVSGIAVKSLAFTSLVAETVANTVTSIIMFAVACIPIVGQIIMAVVAIIDALIQLVCGFLPDDTKDHDAVAGVCKGITGWFAELVKWTIYSQTVMVDLEADDRLAIWGIEQQFVDPDVGISDGNSLAYSASVTTTVRLVDIPADWKAAAYWWQYDYDTLTTAAYQYEMVTSEPSEDENKLHVTADLSRGDTTDWDQLDEETAQIERDLTISSVPLPTAGINQRLSLYVAEAFALPAQECWAAPAPYPPYVPLIPVCYIRTFEDTSYIDLGETIKFDVFPATLDDFYVLAACNPADVDQGYALGWDATFTRNPDSDGDGLLNKTDGGADPNDALWDSDGDGLSDDFELAQGYDPTSADGDNDGLIDSQELRFGCDPYRRDTDGDGLADGEEFFHEKQTGGWTGGWEVVYGLSSDGAPLRTWVSSSPVFADYDMDTISDYGERLYAYSPMSPNTDSVLTLDSEMGELQGDGSVTPTDGFVAPGQTLHYAAEVANELYAVTAQGLFESGSTPAGINTDALAPETFDLKAQESRLLEGDISVAHDATSGKRFVSQTAGALLVNEREEAGFATALLHLDEAQGATTFADASGMPYHHGACAGSSCPTMQQTGMYGYAAQFDGGDAIDLGSFDIEGQVSLAAWVKTDRRDGERTIISHGPDTQGRQVFLRQIDGQYMVGSTGSLGLHDASFSIPVGDVGQWVHLAGVYDGTTWRLYRNGSLVASRALAQGAVPVNAQWAIGAQVGGAGGFVGALDEVAIYDQALAASEVEQLHSRPVLHLPFDEGAGALTYTDDSGLGNWAMAWPTVARRPSAGANGVLRNAVSFDGGDCLIVNNSSSLRLVEPRFTLAAWLKPRNTGLPSYDNYVQGVIGIQSDTNQAYPTLQVVGRKLRAGFSARVGGSGAYAWYSYTTARNVLTREAWNHVVATFDGARFAFYVNGQLCEGEAGVPQDATGNAFQCVSGTRLFDTDAFYIGRTSNAASVYFDKMTMDVEHDAGSKAEAYLTWDGAWLPWYAELEEGDTSVINWTQAFTEQGTAQLMEDDSSSADDLCGSYTYYTDVPAPADHKINVTLTDGMEGTLYTKYTNSAIPFKGVIDDVMIYNRDLQVYGSVNEVEDLYNGATIAMRLRLDEPPGATVFRDWTGQHHGSVPVGSSQRPTSGVAGRVNQAALFDGADDRIDVDSLSLPRHYTLAAWVRAEAWDSAGNTIMEAGELCPWLGVSGDGELLANVSGTTVKGGSIPASTWTHVAYVWDGSTAKLYINGQQVASAGPSAVGGSALRIGDGSIGAPWQGELDDLVVYKRALSAASIAALYESAPQLMLHCDAPAYYGDVSGNGYHAQCDATCPEPCDQGRIDECLTLNGVDRYFALPSANTMGLADSDFTVAAWVKPEDLARPGEHLIFGNDAAASGGLRLSIVDAKPHMSGYGIDLLGETELLSDMWYHLAWVVNDGVGTMLLNGSVVTETEFTYAYAQGNEPVYVGGSPSGDLLYGNLDEVTLYRRALSAREINEIHAYQASWVQDKVIHEITVDNDQPTSQLITDAPYIPMSDPVMAIRAHDATSAVDGVQWRINGGTWADVPACVEAEDGTMYCPTFSPTSEGAYLIETSATDIVGHQQNPPANTTVYVDDSPPSPASGIADDSLLAAPQHPAQINGRLLHLYGTVSDPDLLDGSAGSGVASLDVSVYRADGMLMGTPWQAATLTHQDDNTWAWEIDYRTNRSDMSGNYVANIQSTDTVGNMGTVNSLFSFRVDTTPPTVTLLDPSSLDQIQGIITDTATLISGEIDDAHDASGKAVHSSGISEVEVAYDQTTDGNIFSPDAPVYRAEFEQRWMGDGTAVTNDVVHTGDAMNHAVRGQVGDYALWLDGADDWFETWKTPDLEHRSFTVAFWAKSETPGVILTLGDGLVIGTATGGGYVFNFDGGGAATLSMLLAEDGGLSELGDGWVQYAFVYDHEANQKRVYWRGYGINTLWNAVQVDAPVGLTQGGFLAIGRPPAGGDRYAGALDSVRIYDHAMSTEELSAVDRGWRPVETVTPEQDGKSGTWSTSVPIGLEGFYSIRMRGSDTFTNVSSHHNAVGTWSGMLDNAAPRLELTREFLGEGDDAKTRFRGYAEDLNLTPDDLTCPCAESTLKYEYLDDAWYTEVYTGAAPRLSRIVFDCEEPAHQFRGVAIAAQDAFGHRAENTRGGLRSATIYTATAEVTDLDIDADTAYLALGDQGIETVDISQPVKPALLASTSGPLYGENNTRVDVDPWNNTSATSEITFEQKGPAAFAKVDGITVTYKVETGISGSYNMEFFLISPYGTELKLGDYSGGSARTFDEERDLACFDGEPAHGTWKITVFDPQTAEAHIDQWSISISAASAPMYDLATAGDYVYAAGDGTSLRVFDASNPDQLQAAGYTDYTDQDPHATVQHTDISEDGRFVVYGSEAHSLVPGDTNGISDIFVHDSVTGNIERVSVSSDGMQANEPCTSPRISDDGRFVVFVSKATTLVPGNYAGYNNVFLHDRVARTTVRVSSTPAGALPNGGAIDPAISGNGRYVAYSSPASDIVAGDTNGEQDIMVYDRLNGTTIIVSNHTDGTASDDDSDWPSLSYDGRFVVYGSRADSLVDVPRERYDQSGTLCPYRDLFLTDRDSDEDGILDESGTITTELLSIRNDNTGFRGFVYYNQVSDDGRYVAFSASGTNPVTNDTNHNDVYIYDRAADETRQISVNENGIEGDGTSTFQGMSGDGQYVVFCSDASNLAPGETNDAYLDKDYDIFLWHATGPEIEMISQPTAEFSGIGRSLLASISRDGQCCTFVHESGILHYVLPDLPGTKSDQVYRYERQGSMQLVSYPSPPATSVCIAGDWAYLGASQALEVINISDPTLPVVRLRIFLTSTIRNMAVEDDLLYAVGHADTDDDGLSIYQITHPTTDTVDLSLIAWDTGGDLRYSEVVVRDGICYVGGKNTSTGESVVAYDVSAPSGELTPLGEGYTSLFNGQGLEAMGKALLTGLGSDVAMVDAVDPADMAPFSNVQTTGTVADLRTQDGYVHVANGDLEVLEPVLLPGEEPVLDTIILAPQHETVYSSYDAIEINGWALAAEGWLDDLTVTNAGDSYAYTREYYPGMTISGTRWSATSWTPSDDGVYPITALTRDTLGGALSDTITVTVDTTWPLVQAYTQVFTQAHFAPELGYVALSGEVFDPPGASLLDVNASLDGEMLPSTADGATGPYDAFGHWTAYWHVDPENPPDGTGSEMDLDVTVTDRGGHTGNVLGEVRVDVVAPVTVPLSMTAGVTPVSEGEITDAVGTDLTLTWDASADAAGLGAAPYWVRWYDAQLGLVRSEIHGALDRSSTLAVIDGQCITVALTTTDINGNATRQTWGPLYLEASTTPDYVKLRDDPAYTAWMERGCSLIGVDGRVAAKAQDDATLQGVQRLYASWDAASLRLTWTGANWDTDGDLFFYIDSIPGEGGQVAYNPYAGDSSVVYLPGASPDAVSAAPSLGTRHVVANARVGSRNALSANSPMRAEYAVWVQDASTAWLLVWDTDPEGWAPVRLLSPDEFALHDGQTDILLNKAETGLDLGYQCDLVAYASENDALSLWATMPPANPLSSALAAHTSVNVGAEGTFALTQRYHWDNLDLGVCPNGSQASLAGGASLRAQDLYTVSDLSLSLTANPAGNTYAYIQDSLFWLWADLFGSQRPLELSQSFVHADGLHRPLGDGELIEYVLSVTNQGDAPATGVYVDLVSHYALRLLNGGETTSMQVPLGTVQAGETISATVTGIINLAAAMANDYTPCLASHLDDPDYWQQFLHWAALDATFYDDAHGSVPLDWFWADHPVDPMAPAFCGITSPDYAIAPGDNLLQGYAFDDSAVARIDIEIRSPGGNVQEIQCPECVGAEGAWSYLWSLSQGAAGGYAIRVRAIDEYDQLGPWSEWYAYQVDTGSPIVAIDDALVEYVEGKTLQSGPSFLTGSLADDLDAKSVEVCQGDDCWTAEVELETVEQTVISASGPTAISTCPTCVQVPLVVDQPLTIGAIRLGLNIDHPHRDDLQVDLVAPSGETVRVVGAERSVLAVYANLDVMLSDDAEQSLHAHRGNDALSEPLYDRTCRPYAPLNVLIGDEAQGTWLVRICDRDGSQDVGTFGSAQLELMPRDAGPKTGSWRMAVPVELTDQEGEQRWVVRAYDVAGNVSADATLSYTVDREAPALTYELSGAMTAGHVAAVLTGTVSDASRVDEMLILVQDPAGVSYADQPAWVDNGLSAAVASSGTWGYSLQPEMAGTYKLWVQANDVADNLASVGPLRIVVSDAPAQPTPTPVTTTTPTPGPVEAWVVSELEDTFCPGWTLRYTLNVRNNSTSVVTGMVITDTLPENTCCAELDPGNPLAGVVSDAGQSIRWDVAQLVPGQTLALRMSLHSFTSIIEEAEVRNVFWIDADQLDDPIQASSWLEAEHALCGLPATATPTPTPTPCRLGLPLMLKGGGDLVGASRQIRSQPTATPTAPGPVATPTLAGTPRPRTDRH